MDFTKSLMVIAVLAVAVSVFGLANAVNTFGKLSGLALSSQGNASLVVVKSASILFTTSIINWGNGSVNNTGALAGPCPVASLYANLSTVGRMFCSNDMGSAANNWTNVTRGLVIENNGNSDVTLNLSSAKNATTFIGGDTVVPLLQWSLNQINTTADDGVGNQDGMPGSCIVGLSPITWTDIPGIQGTPITACTNFTYGSNVIGGTSEIEIDLALRIPSNAIEGQKSDLITATAIPYP
jgi:hypothetical protein